MQQAEVSFPDTWPHEYPEELLDQPVSLYRECEYNCNEGWLMLLDGTSIRCFFCKEEPQCIN